MSQNKCGTLDSFDLSIIRDSLRDMIVNRGRMVSKIGSELEDLRDSGETDIVIKNISAISKSSVEMHNYYISKAEKAEQKILSCIRE